MTWKAWNTDEDSAPQETHKNVKDGIISYTNADVVVKLPGWDPAYAKNVAQACLSALKQLIKSDKKLPGNCLVGSVVKKICQSKEYDGLRVKNLEIFSPNLLANRNGIVLLIKS